MCVAGSNTSTACGSLQFTGNGITTLSFPISWSNNVASIGDGMDLAVSIPDTTVAVRKITTGAAGGAFSFTQTNLASNPAPITTTQVGTATPAAPAAIAVNTLGTAITLTEASVAGFTLTSASCVDTNSSVTGNPSAPFGVLAGNVLTIPASNVKSAARLVCTFTNAKIPTVAVQKITTGGFGGSFGFSQTNLTSNPGAISTTAANTATPASPIPIDVSSLNTNVTLTESGVAGYLLSSASCTDTNSAVTNNPSTPIGTLAGNVLTIPAANIRAGATFNCVFSNALRPTVSVQKITTGGVGGPFSYTQTNLSASPAPITTTTAGTATPNAPTAIAVNSLNANVTLTENLASEYSFSSASCTDTNNAASGNPSGSIGSVSGNTLTIPVANIRAGSKFNCVFTNNFQNAAMTVEKTVVTPYSSTAGSTIAYNFSVVNTGNVAISSIAVTDSKITAVSCPVTTLAAGEDTVCTGSYVVTQADVDAGEIRSNSTASGAGPSGAVTSPVINNSTTLTSSPALTIGKTAGTATGNTPGSSLPYTFQVTNTGNVTITGIVVTDPKLTSYTCPVTALAPGDGVSCSGSYTYTQADVDNGQVSSSARASGTPPTGGVINSAGDLTTTVISSTAALSMTKSASAPSTNRAGGTITYTYVIRNTGNVSVGNLSISDPKLTSFSCPVTSLAFNETTTCTGSYTLSQNDVNAGSVSSAATTTGTSPTSSPVSTSSDSTTVAIPSLPEIVIDKTAGVLSGNQAGSTLPYTFILRNTGNVTLSDLAVTDPKLSAYTCPVATLEPNGTTTCNGSYTLVQSDIDAGSIASFATAFGTPPVGAAVSSSSDTTTTPVPSSPALALNKTVNSLSGNTAGSVVSYTFTIENTGNVSVTNLVVSDPKLSTYNCPVTALSPNATTTCTGSYTLTQADVNAGTLTSSATGSATPPTGPVVSSAPSSTTTTITSAPALTIDKTAGMLSGTTAGSTLAYSFVLSNTGNVTLNALSISDPKLSSYSCPVTSLAPNSTTSCTGSYTLTQADVDSGEITSAATALGTSPSNNTVSALSGSTTRAISASPALTIDKSAGSPSGFSAGSTIPYTFTIRNTGNVSVSNLIIEDPKLTTYNCPSTALTPEVSVVCNGSYILTQMDVDAGSVSSAATASGRAPSGASVSSPPDSTTTPINASPTISINKTANPPSGNNVGDTVAYTFDITNSGNVTLSGIVITDRKLTTYNCPTTTLTAGATITCTGSYIFTQADVDAGSVNSSATVMGTPPTGPNASAVSNITSTNINRSPAIAIGKTAGTATGNTVGSTIPYTFVVQNTGNVSLTSIAINDAKLSSYNCPVTTLAANASINCSGSYTLTQADIDAGEVSSSAEVVATSPSGATTSNTSNQSTTPITRSAAFSVDKIAGTPSGSTANSTIDYTFNVVNTGNVSLTNISIDDPRVIVTCPVTSLAPDADTTCSGTYVITQNDVDAGRVESAAAIASAQPPAGNEITQLTNATTTTLTGFPALTVDKVAGAPSGSTAGSTIDYTFNVVNTGNVTLTNIAVADPKVTVSCPETSLAPGATAVCTGTYTMTQRDVNAGNVNSGSATASGISPMNQTVTNSSNSTATPISASPAFTIDKVASSPSGTTAGNTITYTFDVVNTGNVSLTDLNITDPDVTVTCPTTNLAPNASTVCTGNYTITQSDVNSGAVNSGSASAVANPPTGMAITRTSNTTTTVIAGDPALTINKKAGTPSGQSVGSTIPYSYTVVNTGNLSLTNISVSDPDVVVSCPTTALEPNTTVVCTGTYTITQADVNANAVNSGPAAVSGTPPSGPPVSAVSNSTTTAVISNPSLSIVKTAGAPSATTAGGTILYSFLVTNIGDVPLSGISITNNPTGTVSCPTTSLAIGQAITCTQTYTITQANINAGQIVGAATVVAQAPPGQIISAQANFTTTSVAFDSVQLTRTADIKSFSLPGTVATFTYTITNSGNSTLNNIVVTDSKIANVSCPSTVLAASEVLVCTAQYTTTAADLRTGGISSVASIRALGFNQVAVLSEATLTIGFDPDVIRKKTLEAINAFLGARAQVILANQPDRARIVNRLAKKPHQCSNAPTGSIVPSLNNLNINASISSNDFCMNTHNFDFWSEIHGGYFRQNTLDFKNQGAFNVAYFGLDYLINEKVVVGVVAENDYLTQNNSFEVNHAHGSGWLVGPYLSARITDKLYLHTRAGWGKSSNSLELLGLYKDKFDTNRRLYNAELTGDWSLRRLQVTPAVGFTYYTETQNSFIDTMNIYIPGQGINLGQLNIGPELSYAFLTTRLQKLKWRLSLQGLYNFDGSNAAQKQFNTIINGLSARVKFSADMILLSGASISPSIQFDGLGRNQLSSIQGLLQISIPLDGGLASSSAGRADAAKRGVALS